MTPFSFYRDPQLLPLHDKVLAGERLDFADGLTLYQTHDLLGVGHLANLVRERLHGNRAYYIYNQHLNYCKLYLKYC